MASIAAERTEGRARAERGARAPLRRALRSVGRTGSRFEIFFAAAWSNVLSLALPIVILQVYDRVIPNNAVSTLTLLMLGLCGVLALDAVLNLMRSHLAAWRGARIQHILSCTGVGRMLDADLKAFETQGPGVQLQRLRGIEALSGFYAGQEIHLLIDLPFAFLFIALIASVSPQIAGVLLAVTGLLVVSALISGRFLRRVLEERAKQDELRHNFVIEVLRGIHSVKTIGAESLMARRHERLQASASVSNYWVAFHSALARIIGSTFSQVTIVAVAAWGGGMAMRGEISIGALAACTFLAGRTAQPLLRAMGIWAQFQNVRIARDAVTDILSMPQDVRGAHDPDAAIEGALALRDVSFSYGAEEESLFSGVSFEAAPGEVVGITGNNGSGKTTLLWLAMGLLRPTGGRVLLDGRDVRSFDPGLLHRHVAYLPQDGVLFQGTILENMTMYRDDLADRAKRIAEQLGLSGIIDSLPRGYDTAINDSPEEGLPIGVRQRIAITRALVSVETPKLIVFDESNSYLDTVGDEALRQLLLQLRGLCTILLVSHRPSYLALADRVYLLRGGRMIEAGGARARQGSVRAVQEALRQEFPA
jgi:ATP-binding cassette subfamily C protein LapB